jgi:septum formation protein
MAAAPEPPANPPLVLGSGSPRRAALLAQLGLPFEQVVSPEPEPVPGDGPPDRHVLDSARAKAAAVRRLVQEHHPALRSAMVIGADTLVCVGDAPLGKPRHPEEAAAMLRALSGRTHQVYTGVVLIGLDGRQWADVARTQVRMRPLSEADLLGYVDSREPLDKAGAYGIQGLGARFIEHIEGCYYNVVGLPLARLCALLEQAGYDFALLYHSFQRSGRDL